MLDLLTDVVAKAGDLAYAEARFEHRTGERLEVRNGAVHHAGLNDSCSASCSGCRISVVTAAGQGGAVRSSTPSTSRATRRASPPKRYAGVTPAFWGSLDAVCSASDWRPWGLSNCGKGEPGQMMRVSHGAAPARFRGVQVGVA